MLKGLILLLAILILCNEDRIYWTMSKRRRDIGSSYLIPHKLVNKEEVFLFIKQDKRGEEICHNPCNKSRKKIYFYKNIINHKSREIKTF